MAETKKFCIHSDGLGYCDILSDDTVRQYCVEGPCPHEKIVEYAPVKHGRTYTAHEVAEILADEYGDTCACNFNGNDEWLPMKCELLDACPNPVGVACWEQFLKWRDSKEVDNG